MKNIYAKTEAFSLIELMIVIAIIAFLSIISIPSLLNYLSKAKRTEAYINLRSLALAEKAYFAENGKYSTNLTGENSLNWKPEGPILYTYGFTGADGQNYFTGIANGNISETQAGITNTGFTICAIGDIDGDGKTDIISINQDNIIKIIQDDLVS